MQSREADLIRHWNDLASHVTPIRFLKTEDSRSNDFQEFMDVLAATASKALFTVEISDKEGPPAFYIGKAVCYHAIPTGSELLPFLGLLSGRQQLMEMDGAILERLASIKLPAQLKLYVTPQCNFCPQVVRHITGFASANPLLSVVIVDGLMFPEMAGEDGIRSVPTLILDGGSRWTGVLPLEEVLDTLVHRDPTQMSKDSLKSILKEGNAIRVAKMMIDQGCIFPAFVDLLKDPDWSVRLGSMVVVEEMAQENRKLARCILAPLWEDLENVDRSVKGDIIYLFGQAGSAEWSSRLQQLLEVEDSDDLREVLEDAIANLRA